MYSIRLFFTSLFITCHFFINAQAELKLIDSLNFKIKKFDALLGVDIHENFIFKKQNTLVKTNTNEEWEYANLELGEITSISLLNPLQILIFYKSTNRIVLVDHFLSEIKQVDFNNLAIPKIAEWVENTKNQEVWLYNSLNNQLEFFNYKKSSDLATSIPLSEIPISITANFNTVYVLSKNSIKSYNNYGNLLESSPVDSIQKIQLQQNKLIGTSKNKLIAIDKKLKPIFHLKKPKNNTQDFFLSNEKLYIYEQGILYIYKVKLSLE